jgi:hypothetical protein
MKGRRIRRNERKEMGEMRNKERWKKDKEGTEQEKGKEGGGVEEA